VRRHFGSQAIVKVNICFLSDLTRLDAPIQSKHAAQSEPNFSRPLNSQRLNFIALPINKRQDH
jgi:hypothetical protein